jgi:uncharacterized C2H2 Zn-finger protein
MIFLVFSLLLVLVLVLLFIIFRSPKKCPRCGKLLLDYEKMIVCQKCGHIHKIK